MDGLTLLNTQVDMLGLACAATVTVALLGVGLAQAFFTVTAVSASFLLAAYWNDHMDDDTKTLRTVALTALCSACIGLTSLAFNRQFLEAAGARVMASVRHGLAIMGRLACRFGVYLLLALTIGHLWVRGSVRVEAMKEQINQLSKCRGRGVIDATVEVPLLGVPGRILYSSPPHPHNTHNVDFCRIGTNPHESHVFHAADGSDRGSYVAVQLPEPYYVTNVAIQGRGAYGQYVTGYSLFFKTNDTSDMFVVRSKSTGQLAFVNTLSHDNDLKYNNDFHPFVAITVILRVDEYCDRAAWRWEVFGVPLRALQASGCETDGFMEISADAATRMNLGDQGNANYKLLA
jgi:hypothetical protein